MEEKRIPLPQWFREKKMDGFMIETTPVQMKKIMCDADGNLIAWLSHTITKDKTAAEIANYIVVNIRTLEVVFTEGSSSGVPIIMKKKGGDITSYQLLKDSDWVF
jgi:hypothetical protein